MRSFHDIVVYPSSAVSVSLPTLIRTVDQIKERDLGVVDVVFDLPLVVRLSGGLDS